MIYGAKEKLTPEDETSLPLDNQGTKRVQGIIGALLYYARAVENKLLIGLSAIVSQQAAATQSINEAINQIIDYCATYPADRILFALETWFCVNILTQVLTMRVKDGADLELTFSFMKTMPCPDGTAMF